MIGRIAYGSDFVREIARTRARLRAAVALFSGRTRARPVDIYIRADNSLHLALVCLVDEIRATGDSAEIPEDKPLGAPASGPVNFPKVLSTVREIEVDLEQIARLIVGRRGRSVPHVKRAAKSVATLYEALRSESMNPLKGADRA
jgi:hypothetical protein